MQFIYDILNKIGEAIATIWDFVQSIYEWLSMAIDYILYAIQMAYDFIISFPPWIKAFAIATITISVIYTIIGRAGGNSE